MCSSLPSPVCLCGLYCNVAVRGAELRPGTATAPEPLPDDHGLQKNTPLFSPPLLQPPRNHCLSWQQNYVWIGTQQDGLVYFSLMMSHYFGHGYSYKTWQLLFKRHFSYCKMSKAIDRDREWFFVIGSSKGLVQHPHWNLIKKYSCSIITVKGCKLRIIIHFTDFFF